MDYKRRKNISSADIEKNELYSPSPGTKEKTPGRTSVVSILHVIMTLTFACGTFLYVMEREQRLALQQQLETCTTSQHTASDEISKLRLSLSTLAAIPSSKPECPKCPECPAPPRDAGVDAEHCRKQQEVVAKLQSQRETMIYGMQDVYRELLVAKFGSPPYFVDLSVQLPSSASVDHIILQLEPEKMPHSTYYFLMQVQATAWNGCSFIRNAYHVLQASNRGPECKSNAFKNIPTIGESVFFQEYSRDFPHVQYTVGLAGRPGGPDFYISTIDNTLNHGPGGQGQYVLQNEADPCFAKVVQGIEVVEAMHKLPTLPGAYKTLENFVTIVSATIVK